MPKKKIGPFYVETNMSDLQERMNWTNDQLLALICQFIAAKNLQDEFLNFLELSAEGEKAND